jgi:crotonobetainyl-CoA:carnitine CoA-transferase CaiB-like acyl-CoA transferase
VEHPVQFDQPAPLLGAHNEEIYCQRLEISATRLAELRAKGII